MAALSASATPSIISNACVSRPLYAPTTFSARPAAGLPALRRVKVSCVAKVEQKEVKAAPVVAGSLAASALAMVQPALALVDDRLSTEGTGLTLGVSNPLLVWILLGVATLIWALFFNYVSSLKEDDDSGLAL